MQVNNILDAAAAVVTTHGIAKLTFDLVAEKAGLSKGGVLHHFRSKEKLIGAMVKRSAEEWLNTCLAAYEKEPEGPARMTRALMNSCLINAESWEGSLCESSSAIFAALAYDPKLIEPMREVYRKLKEKLDEDQLPPGITETVWAALDGIWLWWVLGVGEISQERLDRVRSSLEKLLSSI